MPKIPEKLWLGAHTTDNLETRRAGLELYLKQLCHNGVVAGNEEARILLSTFLQEPDVEREAEGFVVPDMDAAPPAADDGLVAVWGDGGKMPGGDIRAGPVGGADVALVDLEEDSDAVVDADPLNTSLTKSDQGEAGEVAIDEDGDGNASSAADGGRNRVRSISHDTTMKKEDFANFCCVIS